MTTPISIEPRGYHRLADLMGHYPEAAILRRFSALNMLNLLSLQAELVDLQVQFRDLWAEDESSTDINEKEYSTHFRRLHGSGDSLQYGMLLDIRKKLQEYNAALIQAAQVGRMPVPEPADLRFVREWLGGTDEGDNFLRGNEEYTWNSPASSSRRERKILEKDLLTIYSPCEEQDIFSKILSSSLLDFWNWLRSCTSSRKFSQAPAVQKNTAFNKAIDPDSGILHYGEERLLKFNNILISVLGAALPVLAIVALYFIKTEGGRLGAMTGFTILFALVLAVFTNARRLEIAAATAAFAAVEVVFIGSDLGKP